MLTTTSVFLKTLIDAGITHAFCNWGSDHPAMLEELARLASTGEPSLKVITCPHESVALSAAQGYYQATRRIAAVLVHVDVGTQSLAGAVHNCARGRAPVLIYAGAAPFTDDGEIHGSRNEFIFWLQDAIDQPAIVRQYMRHTVQIHSGKNVSRVVHRALQFAQSEPQGPVYLWARREIMEEEMDEQTYAKSIVAHRWPSIQACPLPAAAATTIVEALASATCPVIITSNIGRNPASPSLLAELCDLLLVPVVASCPTAPVLPPDHIAFAGVTYGRPPPSPQPNPLELFNKADVILILDSDVPFAGSRVPEQARIFHIDVDPLKEGVGTFHAGAEIICRADSALALEQLVSHASQLPSEALPQSDARRATLENWRTRRMQALLAAEHLEAPSTNILSVPTVIRALKAAIPQPGHTLILNEGVSNYPLVWDHLSGFGARVITSGGSSLGWGLGASIGARLAAKPDDVELVVLVVGDGSFLFGIPAAAFWIAQNYDAPFLTVVLNNGGWRSPKLSMLGVHPSGHGSSAQNAALGVAFATDYSGIAAAAGNAWGKRVSLQAELDEAMAEAVKVVLSERRCAVIDCKLEGF
ncbi:acetolactate synthase [Exidia glandulosa HHB12029]|uniref:Acetolactate synthase n=1 Tax=Exidia glandulosa HHB12029 TaxID=1314781 RepID=A0A165HZF3_EXIGL|nr:acetolactate synthase [Exidia glandulosa HHB12029]